MMEIRRRGLFAGFGAMLVAGLAAPSIVRTPGLLMPVKPALILPGDLELRGYSLDRNMAYEWIATELRDVKPEAILSRVAEKGWTPVNPQRVGAETWLRGAQLVQRPLNYHQRAQLAEHRETLAMIEAQRRAVISGFDARLPRGFRAITDA
jgi:hypothetical protein